MSFRAAASSARNSAGYVEGVGTRCAASCSDPSRPADTTSQCPTSMLTPSTCAEVVASRTFGAGRPRASSVASVSSRSPALMSETTAFDTVGALSPLSRATSARESAPLDWITRSTCRSFNFPTSAGRIVVIADIERAQSVIVGDSLSGTRLFVKLI